MERMPFGDPFALLRNLVDLRNIVGDRLLDSLKIYLERLVLILSHPKNTQIFFSIQKMSLFFIDPPTEDIGVKFFINRKELFLVITKDDVAGSFTLEFILKL